MTGAGIAMIKVSTADLKMNLGKYLSLVDSEDIHISNDGVDIAVLSAAPKQAQKPKQSWVDDIAGILSEHNL